jgi:signal transduction histidine kinase
LNWAKSQTGQINFNPVMLNLKAIIIEIFGLLNPTSEIKNISLNYNQSVQVEVYADENMLRTVLRNLISNSIKFTNTNGKIVIATLHKQNFIEISVSDDGVGMNEEFRDKLFKIDKNVTTSGTANEQGSGLGLILCKEFVDKHGGRIWIETEAGKGSTFKFSLPLNKS